MKNTSELIQLGKEVSDKFVQEGVPLNDSLVKVAVAHTLNKEELRRVAEQANVETYLNLVGKADEHYVEFDLADAQESFEKAAELNMPVSTDESDDYADLPARKEFSFSLYKIKTAADAVETKPADTKIDFINKAAELKDTIRILEDELLNTKASFGINADKAHSIIKQAVLHGTSFNNIADVIKLASPTLGSKLIEDFKDDLKKECPFVNLEKTAELNLIPSKTSDLYQRLVELENKYADMHKISMALEDCYEQYNVIVKEHELGPMLKMSGVISEVGKLVKNHPLGTTAVVAGTAGYALAKKSEEPGKMENNQLDYYNAQKALLNKKLALG